MPRINSEPPAPDTSGKPGRDCPLCPRLVAFRHELRAREPSWHNAPVRSFGPIDARVLIVGLAPGLQGANRTGRPFTGDYAGLLLYDTLIQSSAHGEYDARPDDALELVRCRHEQCGALLPENKPTPAEIATCRQFLLATVAEMKNLTAIVALGRIAHESVVVALGSKKSAATFSHGRQITIGGLTLFSSYHCSRYNTNTGVLTAEMFREVFAALRACLDVKSPIALIGHEFHQRAVRVAGIDVVPGPLAPNRSIGPRSTATLHRSGARWRRRSVPAIQSKGRCCQAALASARVSRASNPGHGG